MSTILHLSDAHFGTEQPAAVEALLQLAHEHVPDLLILSGDVTMRARRAQFEAARDFLDRLSVRSSLVIPGNHDIPLYNVIERFVSPFANYQRTFGSDLEPEFESEELLVICVNTTWPLRHTAGRVTPEQVERVARRLRRGGEGQLRVVVTHQPVRVTKESDLKNLLRGHELAVPEWSRAGADLILSGHIHVPHVRPLREVFPGLPRRLWSVLAGTAVSRRVRGDILNSVNLIRYQVSPQPQCTVERWDHDGRDRFRLVDAEVLYPQRP